MDKQQRYRGESLRRVQQFLDAHANVVGVVNSTELRAQLDAAVAALEPTVTVQDTRTREAVGERNNQRALEQTLQSDHMSPIAKFARAELAGVPNFRSLTPEARNQDGARLVQAARAMASAAAPHTATFIAGHFPADFLKQLTAAADAVKASIELRSEMHRQRVGATERVHTAITAGRLAIKRLDARVTRLVAGDAGLLAEWRVARRVVLSSSAAKAAATPPAPAPTASPATESAPAAQPAPGAKVA